jgi:hypothetical protein
VKFSSKGKAKGHDDRDHGKKGRGHGRGRH